jgi:hypothetical protein
MPGVFLYAHAINQIINGYYHKEVNDEWLGFMGGAGFSAAELESLTIMLLEIMITCLVLYGARLLVHKKGHIGINVSVMSLTAVALIIVLALIPVLFGLANFLAASLIFIPLAARQNARSRAMD